MGNANSRLLDSIVQGSNCGYIFFIQEESKKGLGRKREVVSVLSLRDKRQKEEKADMLVFVKTYSRS